MAGGCASAGFSPGDPRLHASRVATLLTRRERVPSESSRVVAMSKTARVTLAISAIFAVGTIWGVHYMQQSEREVRTPA